MHVKQISVFIENSPGTLADFTALLGRENIDLVSLSIADTTHFGILRAIVADHERAVKIIGDAGYTVRLTDVIAASVPDTPGGLSQVLHILSAANIEIEYLYSFVRSAGKNALIVFRVGELEKAAQVLKAQNIQLLTQEEVRFL